MYSSLVWSPDAGVIAPDAAKEWTISDDGKTWTFTLHDNVKYHSDINGIAGPRDGTTMTGKDVEYSMEKIMGLVDGVVSARSGCCLLYTSPSPRDRQKSRMPSSA